MAVFLYGTLRDPTLFSLIAGAGSHRFEPASLAGHAVWKQAETDLPLLANAAGHTAQGLVVHDLSVRQRARLDAYEIPFGYALRPVTVMTLAGAAEASAYFPTTEIPTAKTLWDIDKWAASSREMTIEIASEIAAHDPPLSGAALRDSWGMIAGRAAARLRAREQDVPANIRTDASPADYVVSPDVRLSGGFFRLAGHKITHRRFDGKQSPVLEREVFLGADAALVLPYDAMRDRVLLVEQFRMGPLGRGAPNPWSLEPVAGMVDAGETPEQASLRETAEEAGIHDICLTPMFSFYTSPGSSSDYFYCFLGTCDLPDNDSYSGGLADEAEDLRLHVLSFDDAMALVKSGEINVGPLIAMMLWLERERPNLRNAA